MNKLLNLSICLVCLLTGMSCEREPEEGPASPLDGYVYNPENKPLRDVKVEAFIGDVTIKSTRTDTSGYYIFTDLPAASYRLVFSKQSYGTWKMFGVAHIGMDTTHVPNYFRMPGIIDDRISSVDDVTVYTDIYSTPAYPFLQVEVSIQVVGEADAWKLAYFYNDQPDVSLNSYLYSGLSYSLRDPLNRGLFSPGQKIYGKVYLVHTADNGYYDYYLDEQVYPSINPEGSPVFGFTLPQ